MSISHEERFMGPRSGDRRRARLLTFFVGVAFLASGCAATKFEKTWKDPAFQPGSYKHVLVVGIGRKPTTVQRLETAFAENIALHGARTIIASPLKAPTEKWTEAELRKIVADQDVDAVLLSRLKEIDKTDKDAAHEVAITGVTYSYYGYYASAVTLADSPEGMTYEYAFIETKLFDAKTGKPVWSGTTRTTLDPDDKSGVIREFTKSVTDEIYGRR